MKRFIPADTVDAAGNVWETTGENIRNGAKEIDINAIVDAMFPVNSIYCGENSVILSVGKWNLMPEGNNMPLLLSTSNVTGTKTRVTIAGTEDIVGIKLRLWKRIS